MQERIFIVLTQQQRIKLKKIFNSFIKIIIILSITLFIVREKFVINKSASMEKGIYFLLGNKNNLKYGDNVVIEIPDNIKKLLYERKYLEKKVDTLLKKVAAIDGDEVTVIGENLYINNKFKGKIYRTDPLNRKLPQYLESGKVPVNKILVLGISENSIDSRYFGLINKSSIKSKAILIYKFH